MQLNHLKVLSPESLYGSINIEMNRGDSVILYPKKYYCCQLTNSLLIRIKNTRILTQILLSLHVFLKIFTH